ncbi:DUF349 domain-containing protein [Alteromonas sp. 345S023]|uniref:DUF349 domain-containing protein n=1 Tax=Alteromonas profundi TaxID=2696062 RepID=A0A7X5LKF1_9ALTE|nr:DUF349 domain-containing protein [Alteromonas profundi]NDV90619.1 DUF349 domain-containing protein [Alteromonas profundi]
MIFSRLFAPSHTSQNPEKRLEAIKNLSPEKPSEKTILHELAFNDDNAEVSLAALSKLNSFVLWLKMSQISKNERIQRTAQRKVEACLQGKGELTISEGDKVAFLKESASAELIQQLVISEPQLLDNTELAMVLIEKVAKPSFFQTVFLQHASLPLQQTMLATIDDVAMLQKLEKKTKGQEINPSISARLSALKEAAEKPLLLMRDITLCLSKFNALLDKSDIEDIEQRKLALEAEYNALMDNAQLLKSDDKQEVEAKYTRIKQSLERYLARIRPQWEAEQAEKEIANIEALLKEQINHATSQVNWLYHQRLCEATLADVAVVNEAVRGLEATYAHLEDLSSDSSSLIKATNVLQQLNKKLEGFSMQQQYAQKLVVVVTQAESLADEIDAAKKSESTEETVEHNFSDLKTKYQELAGELTSLPRDLSERWKSASQRINKQRLAEKSEQENQLRQCRKQINTVENLITQGRFRGAMAKFSKLAKLYEGLDKSQQDSIGKRFDNLAQEIERLEGWQSYIAAPRQPALIEEAKALADAPLDDIKTRTEAIRYLRQQWLSLGKQASEPTLQAQFDDALEQAFTPCREYYAKMDAKREEAKQFRQSLVLEAQSIDVNQPEAALAKTVDRLSKAWHQAGQVEKQDYETLRTSWKAALTPAQEKIQAWNFANKQEKQSLVDEAQVLAEAEDLSGAADKAQALQKQWKDIGHAGKRDESRLWRVFKQANDTLFERLKEQRKAKSHEFDQRAETLNAKIDALDINSDDLTFMRSVDEIEGLAKDLPAPLKAKVIKRIAGVQRQRGAVKDKQLQQQVEARATHLVDYLQHYANSESNVASAPAYDASVLGKRWASAIEQRHRVEKSRQWLTVALEAVTDMPSPAADSSMRTDVQLSMMTAKLEQGETIDASDLLEDWIAIGAVENHEQPLLTRVIKVIEAQPELLN